MDNASLRRQLPHGLSDLFHEQAALKTHLEALLAQVFARWGYQRIILPTFEYYESIATGANAHMRQDMYRFFDREGELLALRTDMTVSTARVAGTKLYDQPMPLRFCYLGNVFRYDEQPQAGRRREFSQAGIELIGADTAEADAEVLAIAVEALQALNVSRFQVTLGQVGFLKAILGEAPLANGSLARLEQVIGRRNQVELDAMLEELGLVDDVAATIRALPGLYGGPEVLERARRLTDNITALQALDRLEQVLALLEREGVAQHVLLDLAEVRSMDYYTGITFHGYVEGLGFHVCSGGRYDGLIASFGPSLPAVGFALGVERALMVTRTQVDIPPHLVVSDDAAGLGRSIAQAARALGLRVELDVLGRTGPALVDYGRARQARHVAYAHSEEGLALVSQDGSKRIVPPEALREEMATWSN
jgi:ATP phosphoribosyltransferase regulatory subunit